MEATRCVVLIVKVLKAQTTAAGETFLRTDPGSRQTGQSPTRDFHAFIAKTVKQELNSFANVKCPFLRDKV
jgi:hypothetical protein